jgi:hypothetical protein
MVQYTQINKHNTAHKQKNKNHMIISTDAEKALTKSSIHDKSPEETSNTGT